MAYYERQIGGALLAPDKAMEMFKQTEGMEASKVRGFLLQFNNVDLEKFAIHLGIPERMTGHWLSHSRLLNTVTKEVIRRNNKEDQ